VSALVVLDELERQQAVGRATAAAVSEQQLWALVDEGIAQQAPWLRAEEREHLRRATFDRLVEICRAMASAPPLPGTAAGGEGFVFERAEDDGGRSGELGAKLLFDGRLLAAKDVLANYPRVDVRCGGRVKRGHHMGFIAVAPFNDHGLQLTDGPDSVPRDRRQGGAIDIISPSAGGRAALGTVTAVEDAAAGLGNYQAHPSGPWGDVFALKRSYQCPKCPERYTLLHVTMLRLFLKAVLADKRTVRLGRQHEWKATTTLSTPLVGRADRPGAPPDPPLR
jgi:hypothetical protein